MSAPTDERRPAVRTRNPSEAHATGARWRPDPLLPPQHAAWAFLGLPLVVGAVVAGWSPWLVPLAVAWVAAYPSSWAITGALAAPRPERFRRPALVWTPVTLVAGAPLLGAFPWLAWVLVAYVGLFAVNLAFARARRERAIGNDLVLVAECTGLVPVLAGVVAGDRAGDHGVVPPLAAMTATLVLVAAVLVAITLVGSTLHVKSLIRERRDPAYARASLWFAAASVPLAAAVAWTTGTSPWPVLPVAALAVRARWGRRTDWRPGRLGMVELAGFVAIALSVLALR